MSVGGKVVTVSIQDDVVFIDTIDHGEKCAIYVKRDQKSEQVKPFDIVWWQGNTAYWTTADRETEVETKLIRQGYSGVKSPNKGIYPFPKIPTVNK